MIRVFFFLLFLISSKFALGQYENVWLFHPHLGLDFNGGTALPFATNSEALVVYASVCDKDGDLLFYTDGRFITDRNHTTMPNGTLINGDPALYSTGRESLIIPHPGAPYKYFVFIISSFTGNKPSKLIYSIVDMRLNGGLGDVVPGFQGIVIDSNLAYGKLTGVSAVSCKAWAIVHDADTNAFKAFEITPSGLNPSPVVSYSGQYNFYNPFNQDDNHYWQDGRMRASPNGSKLVVTKREQSPIEVFDFDPSTGVIDNPVPLTFGYTGPGLCEAAVFSHDNSKLYVGIGLGDINSGIWQYDVTTPPPWTPVYLGYSIYVRDLKRGPDGKVYYSSTNINSLGFFQGGIGSINFPNLPGTSSQMTGIYLLNGFGASSGLGSLRRFSNDVPIIIYDTASSRKELRICFKDTIQLNDFDTTGTEYTWSDGYSGVVRSVDTLGDYIVKYFQKATCTWHIDTFSVVAKDDFQFSLGNDTVICSSSPVRLSVHVNEAEYLWFDGSQDKDFVSTVSGTFWVNVSRNGCELKDTIDLEIVDLNQNLGSDTSICNDQPISIVLQAKAPEGSEVAWSTGIEAPSFTVEEEGVYWITVTYDQCIGTDTISIASEVCDCVVSIPSVFSPNSDGRNDLFRPVVQSDCLIKGYIMNIYNRWGQLIFVGDWQSPGWDGKFKSEPADVGTYMYVIELHSGTRGIKKYRKGSLVLIR